MGHSLGAYDEQVLTGIQVTPESIVQLHPPVLGHELSQEGLHRFIAVGLQSINKMGIPQASPLLFIVLLLRVTARTASLSLLVPYSLHAQRCPVQ